MQTIIISVFVWLAAAGIALVLSYAYMHYFGKPRPKPTASTIDTEQELRVVLRASVEIVSAFGACLERESSYPRPIGSLKSSETKLPFPKETIKGAIAILQQAMRFPRSRAILAEEVAPSQTQQILSSQFTKSLESSLIFLDDFVPDKEASAVYEKWSGLQKKVDELLKKLEIRDGRA